MGCRISYSSLVTNSWRRKQQRRNSDASYRSVRSQGASVRLKGGSNFSNDIDVAVFYRDTRLALLEFLSSRNLEEKLLLYEAMSFLMKAKRADIYPILAEMSASVLSKASLEKADLAHNDLRKVTQVLSMTMKESEIIRICREIKGNLEKALSPQISEFHKSQLFAEAVRYIPPVIPRSKKKEKVLIATSNEAFGRIILKMLQDLNYLVTAVQSGNAATGELMSSLYHIALVSMDLQDKSGLRVLQDLIRLEDMCRSKIVNYTRPKFICLINRDSEALRESALKAGFISVLAVPFSQEDLEDIVPSKRILFGLKRGNSSRVSPVLNEIQEIYSNDSV